MLALLNLVIVPTIVFIWIAPLYAGIAIWVIAAAMYGILGGFGINPFGAVAWPAFLTGAIAAVLGYLWAVNHLRQDRGTHEFDEVHFEGEADIDLGDKSVGGGFSAEFGHFWRSLKDVCTEQL